MIHDVAIEGAPADLQARRAACDLLAESGRIDELKRDAVRLEADLLGGRWVVDRATWELTAAQIERWTGRAVPISTDRGILSIAADAIWDDRRRNGPLRPIVVADRTPVTVVWQTDANKATALAVLPSVLRTWVATISTESLAGSQLSVLGPNDDVLIGSTPAHGATTVRALASETGLPWTVVLSPGDGSPGAAELAGRQRLLSVGLAAILLLFSGGGYFLWRLMQRELAVARLQTDFVSAVSHEFRTPLTSLRHVTELLEENDEVPPERRKAFYEALGRNTERLHRLVDRSSTSHAWKAAGSRTICSRSTSRRSRRTWSRTFRRRSRRADSRSARRGTGGARPAQSRQRGDDQCAVESARQRGQVLAGQPHRAGVG